LKKYLFKRDTLLATACVFLIMGLFSLLPLNTHLFDPIKMALSDLSFNDLAFSVIKSHKDNGIDKRIVIVDIGQSSRADIAATIDSVNKGNPSTVALDITFAGPKDPVADSALRSALINTKQLVLAEKIGFHGDSLQRAPNYFRTPNATVGYINFIGEEDAVIRHYSPSETAGDSTYQSFTSQIVRLSNLQSFEQLSRRPQGSTLITYRRDASQYLTIDHAALLRGEVDLSVLDGKIVLVGLANTNANDIEDKFFTPLNKKFAGKSTPDLNGIYIHANILSMVMDQDYTKKVPGWLMMLVSVIVVWLHMAFFLKYYIEKHIWFHLVVKSVQLVSAVLFIYFGILLISKAGIQANFTMMLGGVVLAVDVLYFYEGLAQWLRKKFHIPTVFPGDHH
jgi:CHASE2 domain-containing sensor protein